MIQLRWALSALACTSLLASGCKLPTRASLAGQNESTSGDKPSVLSTASLDLSKHLLIGPEGMNQGNQSELPPREAAFACFKAAQKMDQSGQPEEAIKLYEKARTLDPATHGKVSTRRLAVMYDQLGEFVKATAEYEEALKASPNDADLLNDIGYSYYSRGEWDKAAAHLEKAVAINSEHKRAWMNLGLARSQQHRYKEGYEAFTKAVKPSEACCNLAFVLAAQGRTEEAKAEYRRALELEPGLKIARIALAKLEMPADTPKAATDNPTTQTSAVAPTPPVEIGPAVK